MMKVGSSTGLLGGETDHGHDRLAAMDNDPDVWYAAA